MKKIIITGGLGHIGSFLIEKILKEKKNIHLIVIDNLSSQRIFSLFSPNINSIEVVRKGDVKRAKLYYLRDRTGKSARIADRDRGDEADQYSLVEVSDQIEETQKEEKTNQITEESVKTEENHPVSVAEEKTRVKEKSESSASDAAKTKDESKS